jgi:hypothetical protein
MVKQVKEKVATVSTVNQVSAFAVAHQVAPIMKEI